MVQFNSKLFIGFENLEWEESQKWNTNVKRTLTDFENETIPKEGDKINSELKPGEVE